MYDIYRWYEIDNNNKNKVKIRTSIKVYLKIKTIRNIKRFTVDKHVNRMLSIYQSK